MTVEYLVLGIVLILMGGVQIWLRHGPGAKALRSEEAAGAAKQGAAATGRSPGGARSGRAWNAWTAILGGVGIAFGIVLVVLGALGR
jgi:hypothetical protein